MGKNVVEIRFRNNSSSVNGIFVNINRYANIFLKNALCLHFFQKKYKKYRYKIFFIYIKEILLSKQYSVKKNMFNTGCFLRFETALLQETPLYLPKNVN